MEAAAAAVEATGTGKVEEAVVEEAAAVVAVSATAVEPVAVVVESAEAGTALTAAVYLSALRQVFPLLTVFFHF